MNDIKHSNLEENRHYLLFVRDDEDENIIEYYNRIKKDHDHFKHWIFRGESNAKYGLKSSLDRAFEEFNPKKTKTALERVLLRKFQRNLHLYVSDLPSKHETLEWMSLMRHYGGPTRLLDWTYSFYVALFFAVENAKDDCAVWAIDSKKWTALAEDVLKICKSEAFAPGKDPQTFDKHFMKPGLESVVYPINPFHLNQRSTIQQSIFMCPSDVNLSFEFNLIGQQSNKGEILLRKFIIHAHERHDVLKELYRLNITRATLFPDLEGFTESLKTLLLLPETWDQ